MVLTAHLVRTLQMPPCLFDDALTPTLYPSCQVCGFASMKCEATCIEITFNEQLTHLPISPEVAGLDVQSPIMFRGGRRGQIGRHVEKSKLTCAAKLMKVLPQDAFPKPFSGATNQWQMGPQAISCRSHLRRCRIRCISLPSIPNGHQLLHLPHQSQCLRSGASLQTWLSQKLQKGRHL
jgi:hypothetical protein